MNRLLEIINVVLENRGKEIISNYENFSEETDFRKDLGFDSLDLAELTVRIEIEYDIDIFADGIVYTVGDVISIGTPKTGLHAAISAFGNLEEDSEAEILYLLGTRYHILILEYTNLKSWAEKDFNGIISFGFRISGKKISWDIGGFRPINEEVTNSPLILLPFLKATVHFGG